MKYPKRSQYKYAKSRYRIRNWPEYEAGLQRRGNLTVWLSDNALDSWRAPPSGKPGGQRIYADVAIEIALTIRMVLHLPLRQTEGFLRSLTERLDVEIPIRDHTTLSRRLKKLGEIPFRAVAIDRPIHLIIDSTGLRIHVGHLCKPPKHRAWRKLRLVVDASRGELVASDLSGRRTRDCARAPVLLDQINDPVASISADGAYDTERVYEAAQAKGEGRTVRVVIPTGRNAPVESKTVGRVEGEEPERPRHQQTRPTRVAQAIRLQQACHGRERDLSIQDDHRRRHEESHDGGPTRGGATRVQGPQHDDQSRDARQLSSGVIPSRGTGDLSSAPSHAPTPHRGDFNESEGRELHLSPQQDLVLNAQPSD